MVKLVANGWFANGFLLTTNRSLDILVQATVNRSKNVRYDNLRYLHHNYAGRG